MAQKRRKERMMKRRQRRITALCIAGGIGAMLLSLVICLLLFDIGGDEVAVSAPASTALPYDATQPFSISDLTAQQLTQIRSEGRISVSDGPRGVSVGDTLDEMLTHFPSSYTGAQPSEDEQILYCADYYENQNGIMTVLPPRGLMTVESPQHRRNTPCPDIRLPSRHAGINTAITSTSTASSPSSRRA